MLIHRCLAVACRTIVAGAILATSLFGFRDLSRPPALPFQAQQAGTRCHHRCHHDKVIGALRHLVKAI
jgi:hypothetical protein